MSDCGFILNGLCMNQDMECYSVKCAYSDITKCPVHNERDSLFEEDIGIKNELWILKIKLESYKKDIESLRGELQLRDDMIKKLRHCINECDPWYCEQIKEGLIND
jgi:hypothetical protein